MHAVCLHRRLPEAEDEGRDGGREAAEHVRLDWVDSRVHKPRAAMIQVETGQEIRRRASNIKLEQGGHLWVQELSDRAKPVGWMTGMTAPKFSPGPEPALSRPRSRKLGLEERLIGDVLDERICLPGLTCFFVSCRAS